MYKTAEKRYKSKIKSTIIRNFADYSFPSFCCTCTNTISACVIVQKVVYSNLNRRGIGASVAARRNAGRPIRKIVAAELVSIVRS